MSFSWGDSFDLYATVADMTTGYWDSTTGSIASWTFSTGRFAERSLHLQTSTQAVVKSSGQNDAVHHLACAYRQTATAGSGLGTYVKLMDGSTPQCAIGFLRDGSIVLMSGNLGATLATYAAAVPLQNTWYHFEFEVVINNTTGSFKVRKNGNASDDHSTTGINTRGGTANNYANAIALGMDTGTAHGDMDDLFWRSAAAAGTWLGDIRCYTRMPASDASVTWSRSTGSTNFSAVDEAQQNAATDYVYSSNPGDADFYGIATIATTPATVIATTVRAYMQKSDTGSRTAAVQLKSGATTVASSTVTLSNTGWLWAWRTDLTDPNTGAAWTPANVAAAQIGPKCVA